ncbi:4-alpha-glucanotransferase [Burkholderia stagnalis]|uniref:4-alpha-glucanotransferase n=1 Tax=Burkholderia stagnalis TaxID=1503054 RepID=UPI00075592FD|nr:4-alpha-glucanotransferase [Burkholderia stagnalis]KVC59002.1 4-alpha-glucanotransferase [Burkholderia stagnalis]KVN21850.1 4-alpha-glucanotransferase [Burkholderia stagnalis]KWI65330.1 4-alpha-glucanotransferase [Burkholderia stagnalis]KWK63024.1 4-alpha-glucanotransferase [Burkholderia stagnalis]KWN24925.1 4-alpha-glucanotransferase [Burkholderia stagnalis]
MTTDVPITTLAQAAGLDVEWTDAAGVARRVPDDALTALVAVLGWPCGTAAERADSAAALAGAAAAPPRLVTGDAGEPIALPPALAPPGARFRITLESGEHVDGSVAAAGERGTLPPLADAGYHALDIGGRCVALAIAPARTFADAIRAHCAGGDWGIAAQLYGLRRAHDAGCGDFRALAQLAALAARHGAQALAISPTHALFPALPARDSPYSPSSRRWHNVAYVDPDAVPGAEAGDMRPTEGDDALADGPLIDWPTVLPHKLRVLRARFDAWRAHGGGERGAFRRFRAAGGAALDAHARFDALQAYCIAHGFGADWRKWPVPWRTPASAEVDAFAHANAATVAFHAFLQWCAARGLADAQQAARAAGMAIGLIGDLAVGSDHAGSDAWAHGAALLRGASLGAPPDLFNAGGQAWGVTTWTPAALQAQGFAPFVDLLRAAFAHAGGLRIDHVLGFARIWIVPDGASPRDGAYLRYPCDDLLRLVALEAARHRAIAIGEDLGTVPAGFRARLAAHGIGGIRALWFERAPDGAFLPPDAWDRDAIATTSTHDLPTVAGWWRGVDLGWRRAMARLDDGNAQGRANGIATAPDAPPDTRAEPPDEAAAARDAERAALWLALRRAGRAPPDSAVPPADAPPVAEALAYVAQTPAPLALLPLEDLLGLDAQPNVPGPPCGHPNWRRRLPRPVDALFDADARMRIAAVVRARAGGCPP